MIIDKIKEVKNTLEEALLSEDINSNLSKTERVLSIAGGTYITLKGLRNIFSSPLIAAGELYIGFGLLQRGVSGYCNIAEKYNDDLEGPEPVLIVEEPIGK
ncbi:DUF2892 domain-containing protein [Pedobacter sp. SD-b]|uniref:DUF2892 domain-containing protein n=1 Tax=Pedobacter segetis TaxID=2793069 RepID=A0ABS1BK76_9SPHI|nr:DUF2892 domain-containing protein [Pedobacter segetis]MBK0383295.1 DUF2892 domain-containing protein [Pedobacter segetis]